MIDYGKFEKSLKHLEAQLQNYRAAAERTELKKIDREAIEGTVMLYQKMTGKPWT